jgi:hypothetical protein
MSGDAARVHFGIPSGASIQSLQVRWPDGALSSANRLQVNQLVTVTR